ncbi:hypothetical protein HHI36_015073 [Cryptolaemus montrouzieri]|uniref:Uncharacterized protein n=1 Tax=Cryptolaemus montrouzieri TaxID=559131 RepID=A0ABD2N4I7_9CUCU
MEKMAQGMEEAKSNREASGVQGMDVSEKIIGEMMEKRRGDTNILLTNVEESKAGSAIERKAEDTEFVRATSLAKLNVNSDNIRVLSRDEVVNVLKNKKLLHQE